MPNQKAKKCKRANKEKQSDLSDDRGNVVGPVKLINDREQFFLHFQLVFVVLPVARDQTRHLLGQPFAAVLIP